MRKTGQSTLEYALIIAVVLGALLAMNNYMRRGVQGRLRSSADSIGDQFSAGNTTYKTVTQQTTDNKTKETFGLSVGADGQSTTTKDVGVSNYYVEQAGEKKVKMDGASLGGAVSAKETITKDFSGENIFDQNQE